MWLPCFVLVSSPNLKVAFLHKSFTLFVVVTVIEDDKIALRAETMSVWKESCLGFDGHVRTHKIAHSHLD